jgi:hypothetical protein
MASELENTLIDIINKEVRRGEQADWDEVGKLLWICLWLGAPVPVTHPSFQAALELAALRYGIFLLEDD